MKFNKNLVATISAAIFSSVLLTGCDDPVDYLNRVEVVLLKQCEQQTLNKDISCKRAYTQTIEMAQSVYRNTNHSGNPADKPFQEQGLVFVMEDKAFKKSHPDLKSLNEFWHELSGGYLYDAPVAPQSDEIKKLDASYVLSPTMYDELIQAVKTCNRATVEAMNFKVGTKLSAEQYDKAMNIIIECKQSQLDQAINSKG